LRFTTDASAEFTFADIQPVGFQLTKKSDIMGGGMLHHTIVPGTLLIQGKGAKTLQGSKARLVVMGSGNRCFSADPSSESLGVWRFEFDLQTNASSKQQIDDYVFWCGGFK
jgi:hypothetical protein